MAAEMTMSEAAATARTGDVVLFRGPSVADRAIRAFTNSPVNHVGMVIAIDDLPPLLWHAELGQSLPDVWSGTSQRGTQLHRLVDAVGTWRHEYGQSAWLRQIDIEVTTDMEDDVLRVVNELDGTTFPRTGSLVTAGSRGGFAGRGSRATVLAEVVAITYERMGLLESKRPPNWYDPGTFGAVIASNSWVRPWE